MPRAIPVPIRRAIVDRQLAGQSLDTIARDLDLPNGTVRSLWRRYRRNGEAGPSPDYHRCGRSRASRPGRMMRAACWLRRHDPSWGADLIRDLLRQRWPDRTVPCPRSLQRGFRQAGLNRCGQFSRDVDHRIRPKPRPHEHWSVPDGEQDRAWMLGVLQGRVAVTDSGHLLKRHADLDIPVDPIETEVKSPDANGVMASVLSVSSRRMSVAAIIGSGRSSPCWCPRSAKDLPLASGLSATHTGVHSQNPRGEGRCRGIPRLYAETRRSSSPWASVRSGSCLVEGQPDRRPSPGSTPLSEGCESPPGRPGVQSMTTSFVRSTKRGRGLSLPTSIAAALSAWIFGGVPAAHAADPPFSYVRAKALHIPPETTTGESGYFSLCEGRNGKIYIGTAAYGRDSYLVEFNPATERMRVVLDTHKLVGLPLTPSGYAAQAKLHTRNFVGPSGKIYVGSKQGYPGAAEREALKRGKKIPVYRGGYVMVYDPATDTAENLVLPMPLDDKQIAAGKAEGQGVIDVTADESRGLIYVITCEEQHWMLYDTRTRTYRELGPILRDQPNTLIDARGRGTAITVDYRVARYAPATDKVTIDPLLVEGKPFAKFLGAELVHPDWRIMPDGKTAYLQLLDDLRMFRVDLSGPVGRPVTAWNLGDRVRGKHPDSRRSISIGPDGRVY